MGRSGAVMAGVSQLEGTWREMKHVQLLGDSKGRVCPVGLLGLYCLVKLIPTGKILYEYIATEALHRVHFVMSYGGTY